MTEQRPQATAKDPATNVRLPADLMAYIDLQARVNGRSRNTEIIMRLRQSMRREKAA